MSKESNQNEDKIRHDMDQVGWSIVLIEGSDYLSSFTYTIGLWRNYNHPEIICFGLKLEVLHSILNIAGQSVKNGKSFHADKIYTDFFQNNHAQFVHVDKRIRDYFGYAIKIYSGVKFPCLQLVWTDGNNQFPWNESYQKELQFKQPLLDRNADFKFQEDKNLSVFTTRQWLKDKKPILRVIHDADGNWQFLTDDQPEDICVVSLLEMINSDETLNELFDLEYGEQANRPNINSGWTRSKY